jgi:nanoRNase/pAp phosphatase (c-di-AMP/oligoRNAs hydrolase)
MNEEWGRAKHSSSSVIVPKFLALRLAPRYNSAMRLVTRGDLDGLTSAVIITLVEPVDELLLVHPQDITDKRVEIRGDDILANVPYDPRCGMWFDHHLLTDSNEKPPAEFRGRYGLAESAARLVYDYYLEQRPDDPALLRLARLVDETDRLDAALLTPDDVDNPRDYILLGYTIDSRTGLGNFDDYFRKLVGWLKTMTIAEVLAQPEVAARVERIRSEAADFRALLQRNSFLIHNVVVTDLREIERLPAGNRFLIYSLFPTANVSLRVHWGPSRDSVVAAVGHSIFNRTCTTSVGELMSRYGGGGHRGAGTCILPVEHAAEAIDEILFELQSGG